MNSAHCVTVGALAALSLFITPTLGQACGVKNHMRLVNRVNSGTEPEIRIDTGWQSVAPGSPLVTPGTASDSSPLGVSQGSWVASSDFGRLAFSGGGSGTNSPGNGIFLWIDEWIGGEPKSQFKDNVSVISPSLPAGTPVTVRVRTIVAGFATCSAPPPAAEQSYGVSVNGLPGLDMNFASTSGQQVKDCVLAVGQSYPLNGKLNCTIRDYRIAGATVYSDTIQAHVQASVSIAVLTPGASLQFCSQAQYAPCTGDFNADGQVNDSDFVIFLGAYNLLDCADPAMTAGCPADLNADGVVDDADFVLFLAGYNALVCP